jgi:hypothetical protein
MKDIEFPLFFFDKRFRRIHTQARSFVCDSIDCTKRYSLLRIFFSFLFINTNYIAIPRNLISRVIFVDATLSKNKTIPITISRSTGFIVLLLVMRMELLIVKSTIVRIQLLQEDPALLPLISTHYYLIIRLEDQLLLQMMKMKYLITLLLLLQYLSVTIGQLHTICVTTLTLQQILPNFINPLITTELTISRL